MLSLLRAHVSVQTRLPPSALLRPIALLKRSVHADPKQERPQQQQQDRFKRQQQAYAAQQKQKNRTVLMYIASIIVGFVGLSYAAGKDEGIAGLVIDAFFCR